MSSDSHPIAPATAERPSPVVMAEVVEEALSHPQREVRPPRRWLPLLLFAATCLTTFGTYAAMDLALAVDAREASLEAIRDEAWLAVKNGLYYSAAVMTILICHEMGHFLQARRYRVRASLPYFIPLPLPPLGTMGAVIVMESRIANRRALFDIGISGPLAGLVPTLIFCVIGVQLSTVEEFRPQNADFQIGAPLLFRELVARFSGPIPEGFVLSLHPIAFAGWVGLFLTSLNLIPVGQLDGSHVLYAMIRRRAHWVAWGFIGAVVSLMFLMRGPMLNWIPLLLLLLVMGPAHPPTSNDREPLGLGRYILGALTLAFIIVGFTPQPLKM
ncbi:MAG: site-2 protease family protein [Planctomycetota bacterium]